MLLAANTGRTPIATIKITCTQKVTDEIVIKRDMYIGELEMTVLTMKVKGNNTREMQ
jgi:hypothetical protein